jgi:hypothetical protein
VLASAGVQAKKDRQQDPALERRQQFVVGYTQLLERAGWEGEATPILAGKNKDVLLIWMPGELVERMYRFENLCVEPLLKEEASEMKDLSFIGIEIKTDSFSVSFPKGVWDLPLQ